jgi:hypothetical protein
MQTGYDLAEKATCSKIQYNNRRKTKSMQIKYMTAHFPGLVHRLQ